MIRDFVDGTQFVDDGVRPNAQWTGPPWDDVDSEGTSGEVVVAISGTSVDWGGPGSLCSKCHSNWLGAYDWHSYCTGCQTCHGHGQSYDGYDWGPGNDDHTSCFEIEAPASTSTKSTTLTKTSRKVDQSKKGALLVESSEPFAEPSVHQENAEQGCFECHEKHN